MTDGAAAVLLGSEAWARERQLPVLAYLAYGKVAAVDFVDKKEGLLMAPAYAVPRMLKDANLQLQDFDFYEIHEAFAGQVLCTLKAWDDPAFCKRQAAPAAGAGRASTAASSTSRAAASPSAIRSPPPARASSRRSPRFSRSTTASAAWCRSAPPAAWA